MLSYRNFSHCGKGGIGASCHYVRIAGKNIVMDCGAVPERENGKRQTKIAGVEEIEKSRVNVELILISHAHLDHIGGVILLAQKHPKAEIFASAPTIATAKIILADTIRIAQRENRDDFPYGWADYDEFFCRVKPVSDRQWFNPLSENLNLQVCFWPCGHIRGAASILIKDERSKIMFSGDVSFSKTPTLKTTQLPTCSQFQPDLLICEGTYGGQALPLRKSEENRLVNRVREIVERGGNVLIPAFATGRSSDIALCLANKGFKVFLGGMANKMHEEITPLQWCDLDKTPNPRELSRIRPIMGYRHAGRLALSKGVIVVATSGMLEAGKSRDFAYVWIDNPANAIFFPGFQAEETAGKQLLNLQRGQRLEFPERRQPSKKVLAAVEKFELSAHADGPELLRWIRSLKPRNVILVHGERDRLQSMEKALEKGFNVQIGDPKKDFCF